MIKHNVMISWNWRERDTFPPSTSCSSITHPHPDRRYVHDRTQYAHQCLAQYELDHEIIMCRISEHVSEFTQEHVGDAKITCKNVY